MSLLIEQVAPECFSKTKCLRRRQKTRPMVEALDAAEMADLRRKRDEFISLPPSSSAIKRAMRDSYFEHIYHTVAIEGNTLSLGQTRYPWGRTTREVQKLQKSLSTSFYRFLSFFNST